MRARDIFGELRRNLKKERAAKRKKLLCRVWAGIKKFFKWAITPPGWVMFLVYSSTLLLVSLAVLFIVMSERISVYAILFYVISALSLVYSAAITARLLLTARRKVITVADRYTFTRKFRSSFEFRTVVSSAWFLICNLAYAVFLCYMSIFTRSIWYGALTVYYVLLTLTRGGVLFEARKNAQRYKDDPVQMQNANVDSCFYCGVMLIALTLALSVAVAQMVDAGAGFRHPEGVTVYAFAAFAVFRIATTVSHFVKARRYDDPIVCAIRYVNLAAALLSVLSLQTALFDAFLPSFDPAWINGVTGGLVCASVVFLGARMLFLAKKMRNRLAAYLVTSAEEIRVLDGYNREEYREEYGEASEPSAPVEPSEKLTECPEVKIVKSVSEAVAENKSENKSENGEAPIE